MVPSPNHREGMVRAVMAHLLRDRRLLLTLLLTDRRRLLDLLLVGMASMVTLRTSKAMAHLRLTLVHLLQATQAMVSSSHTVILMAVEATCSPPLILLKLQLPLPPRTNLLLPLQPGLRLRQPLFRHLLLLRTVEPKVLLVKPAPQALSFF
jgi:hypothetical protein